MKHRGVLFAALAGLFLWAVPAHAQSPSPLDHKDDWTVGVDADYGPLPPRGTDLMRFALTGRFGYRYGFGSVFAVPEASLGFAEVLETRVQNGLPAGYHSEQAWIGAGGRLGTRFGRFEPSAFAHGYIWFAGPGDVALDGGIALDLRLTSSLSIGIHGAWMLVHAGFPVKDATQNLPCELLQNTPYACSFSASGDPKPAEFVNFGVLGLHINVMR